MGHESPGIASDRKKRIFLSYGRDEYVADADRIHKDLAERGHDVWFDLERVYAGRDWEAAIERGLRECDLMVLLMTPHSVRRRDARDPTSTDGYCLNEIAAALRRNKLIIPVLLVSLEPDGQPNSIDRLQYIDLRDGIPIRQREDIYKERFERLVRAIEWRELDDQGGQARLISQLKPLSFEQEIGRHIAGFHGRAWLFDEIHEWVYGRPESRVFWLTGMPGVGKTAVAGCLCHTRREVIAHHICKATNNDWRDPVRAVLSIAYQMSQHLPAYERSLQNLDLTTEALKNAPTLFQNIIVRPLRSWGGQPDGPRVVIIDAIDEATRNGRNDIAALIADGWEDTPSWLRLIVTSRPEETAVVATLARLRPRLLDAHGAENRRDLREYLERGLAEHSAPARDELLDAILDRSGGLFLYVEMVLDALRNNLLSLDRLDGFPVGLGGHYQQFFDRQFANPDLAEDADPKARAAALKAAQTEYARKIRPLLAVICAQREPLPLPVLQRALSKSSRGTAPGDLIERLTRLGSLFPRAPQQSRFERQTVAPFHKSIRDWLTESPSAFRVDLAKGEERLAAAAAAWEDLEPGAAQSYLVRHGTAHMVNAGQFLQACNFVHDLLHHPQLPDDVPPEELQAAGRHLCAEMERCPPAQARRLPGESLVEIAVECGGIDHYAMEPCFRLLYLYKPSAWLQLRQQIVQSDNWSAMYALSLAIAAEHGRNPRRVLSEIAELTASTSLGDQELGLYILKLLDAPSAMLMDRARVFATSRGFLVPALVHEFLLTQALAGEDACEFVATAGLWNTCWPYHRTQLDDIAAVQELVRRSLSPFSDEAGVKRAREELAAAWQRRDELLAEKEIEDDLVLRGLLSDYERLPRKLKTLPAAAGQIRRSRLMDRLLLTLFAHPAWEVRAGAARVAADIAAARPEAASLIAGWIDHPDYRVRYGAIECAYQMRYQDEAALFERAVRTHAGDEQAWVRGIVADCLAEWIGPDHRRDHANLLERFKPEVIRLLHDTDLWPIESMVALVRGLQDKGVNARERLGVPIGGLLAQVPGWDSLGRAELQRTLDAIVRTASLS